MTWINPILQQITQTGQNLLAADQLRRQRELDALQRDELGLRREMNAFQIANMREQTEAAKRHRNAFAAAMQQIAGPGRELDDIDMRQFARLYVMQGGDPEMAMKMIENAAKSGFELSEGAARFDASGRPIAYNPKKPQLTGEALNISILQNNPVELEKYIGIKERLARAGSPQVSLETKIANEKENALVSQGLKMLPEVKQQASSSRAALERIDQALNIITKHGGDVVGVPGMFRRWLAPFAKPIGMDVDKASDAQILDALLTAGAGGLRSQVVGPGPVTNYEQNILQKVGGGAMSHAEGVKAILDYHRRLHLDNIRNYNEQVEAISSMPGYEKTKQVFKPFDITDIEKQDFSSQSKKNTGRRIVREGTYNGRRVVEYDDGKVEYAE